MGNSIGIDASGTLIRVSWSYSLTHTSFNETYSTKSRHKHTNTAWSSSDVDQACIPTQYSDSCLPQYRYALSGQVDTHATRIHTFASTCPYQKASHRRFSPDEQHTRQFIASCPLWSIPRTFCCVPSESCLQKIVCCVICWKDIFPALKAAKRFLIHKFHTLHLTGSRASELQQVLISLMLPKRLNMTFFSEINCILKAVDFLVSSVPESLFRYAKTHKAINSVIPDTASFKVVPLPPEELEHFYPFLLINLKAGVSFHLVTAPDKSVRVGGSTIGGGTFMGLIRLLCRNVHSPLDAFLLAQSGDNSSIDLLISDIYGGDYTSIGLKKTTIASTCGKLQNIKGVKTVSSVKNGRFRWVKAPHSQGSFSLHKSKTVGDVLSSRHLMSSSSAPWYCSDPLCCCCGTRRWNKGEISTEVAAAAAGIFSHKTPFHESSLLSSCFQPSKISRPTKKNPYHSPTNSPENETCQSTNSRPHYHDTNYEVFESDIACSILTMMSYNVAQLAYLNCVIHKCSRILLVGYYLEMPGYLSSVQHCIDFWSKGTCQINFARLAPNLGALGACLQCRVERYSPE